jgi:hypothetical protein
MRRTSLLAGAVAALATTLGPAPGALAAGAVFGGSTSGDEAIVIYANKAAKKLSSAVISWDARCGDGRGLPLASVVTPATTSPGFSPGAHDLLVSRNAKGRFAGTQLIGLSFGDSAAAVVVKLAGKLGAKTASGTLSAEATIVEAATGNEQTTCRTGVLHWKASRAPGRIYGGKTSQEEPFVVKVDAKRKRVTDVLLSWESSCNPDGFLHYPERLDNFPLASTGRFGDTWDDTVRDGDGGTRKFGYALTGHVARRSASGTLRVGMTRTDAGGATTRSCDSGGISWKATTG